MTAITRTAEDSDLAFLAGHDHLDGERLREIARLGRILVAEVDRGPVGWLRWNYFWDEIPFMNMLFVLDDHRGLGHGRRLVEAWEAQMASIGHPVVLTSSLADETAQHLYRRLGYADCGSLLLPGEATEIIFRKKLAG